MHASLPGSTTRKYTWEDWRLGSSYLAFALVIFDRRAIRITLD
jgi:hypothetical protein